jgi:hypothetical protein
MKGIRRWMAAGAVGALALLAACQDRTQQPQVQPGQRQQQGQQEPQQGTGGAGTGSEREDAGMTGHEQTPGTEDQMGTTPDTTGTQGSEPPPR